MPRIATFAFKDPTQYGAAIRAAEVEVLVTARGDFSAQLLQIDLDRLWMQYGEDNLPRVFRSRLTADRTIIAFLADADQAAMQHTGIELSPDAIVVNGLQSSHHHRTWQPCRWATMSLAPEDLAAASRAIIGREFPAPAVTRRAHPASMQMARLVALHGEARRLAVAAPETFARPEVSRALEDGLVHAMLTCLAEDLVDQAGSRWRHHSAIIKRFEDLLAANIHRPLYLTDICKATGASERTLRVCCQEHLGMGPIRYLWLRRMHLARRALLLADPSTTSVTGIATDHGFWEFGRFAAEYRKLFGEAPSASLRRPQPRGGQILQTAD